MDKVDNKTDEIFKAMATAGILGTLAAAVRALVVSSEPPLQRLRTFFAGVLMSLFLGLLLTSTNLSDFYKDLIVGSMSAFVSTIWPLLERLVKKWVNKKGNDVV